MNLSSLHYRLKTHIPYRLTIHTLDRNWHDRDEILLHGAFQVLVDFIDDEHPGETINWESDPGHSNAWAELTALYHWWKVDRPSRPTLASLIEHLPQPVTFEEEWTLTTHEGEEVYEYTPHEDKYPDYYVALRSWHGIEKGCEDEDDANLARLISVRRYMWT